MNILADDRIALLTELFSDQCHIKTLPGNAITSTSLQDTQLLLTRTITSVNQSLLEHTPVRFVGTVTSGTDHLDTQWLAEANIPWASAQGANAKTVAEYVLCTIASLRQEYSLLKRSNLRAGVIGVGHVGSVVAHALSDIGFDVICNDPPRARQDSHFISTPLNEFDDLDLICIHTPLTTTGEHATFHLINDEFLSQLKSGCVLINAARGGVIDSNALLKYSHIYACLDVWENEPHINIELLKHATIATPHIAGYSLAAKYRATWMVYQQAKKLFELKEKQKIKKIIASLSNADIICDRNSAWESVALDIYNPVQHTKAVKHKLLNSKQIANDYEHLRRNYRLRKEFYSH